MLPICYEEALPNGPTDQCAEFLATATEMFVKDVVGSVLSLVRSNITAGGAKGGGVFTSSFKRSSVMDKKNSGLTVGMGIPLGMGDLRVALGIADCSLGQMPDIINDIMGGWPEGVLEGWDTYPEDLDLDIPGSLAEDTIPKTNGVLTNGLQPKSTRDSNLQHEQAIDQWPGSGSEERNQLFGLLDDCMAIGQ